MKKGTGLKFTWITDFNLVPMYLLEQVQPKEWEAKDLFAFIKANENKMVIGVFYDKKETMDIKGFVCGNLNPLTKALFIHILSIDREYQNKNVISETIRILRKYCKQKQIQEITMQTTRPGAFEKAGMQKSDKINMELEV